MITGTVIPDTGTMVPGMMHRETTSTTSVPVPGRTRYHGTVPGRAATVGITIFGTK